MDHYGTSFNINRICSYRSRPLWLVLLRVENRLSFAHELLHRLIQVVPPGEEQARDHLRIRLVPRRLELFPGALPDDVPPLLPLLILPHKQERRPPHRAIQRESLPLRGQHLDLGPLFGILLPCALLGGLVQAALDEIFSLASSVSAMGDDVVVRKVGGR